MILGTSVGRLLCLPVVNLVSVPLVVLLGLCGFRRSCRRRPVLTFRRLLMRRVRVRWLERDWWMWRSLRLWCRGFGSFL